MPLIENTELIYKKYDRASYSPGCLTYMKADETTIVCIIVHEKERTIGVDKLMEKAFKRKKLPECIRGHYVGDSLVEFDKWLRKYFKYKGEK